MIGMGTAVNALAIVVGGLCGLISRRFLNDRFQETVTKAMGFAVIVMALGSVLSQMLAVKISESDGRISGELDVQGTMVMIVSIAIGALIGEFINLHKWFERFGAWLRDKSGSRRDGGFIDAFVSSSLTVCVGAMAIIGSIQDGMSASREILYAKAVLDMVIVMMMTVSLGKGCIFSVIPVVLLQGTVTALAWMFGTLMTQAAVSNLSLVGNVLIICVGVNLIWPKTIRVANVLPAIVISVLFAMI